MPFGVIYSAYQVGNTSSQRKIFPFPVNFWHSYSCCDCKRIIACFPPLKVSPPCSARPQSLQVLQHRSWPSRHISSPQQPINLPEPALLRGWEEQLSFPNSVPQPRGLPLQTQRWATSTSCTSSSREWWTSKARRWEGGTHSLTGDLFLYADSLFLSEGFTPNRWSI